MICVLLQLDSYKVANDTDYGRQIIEWAVSRMRPDTGHMQMSMTDGRIVVWEAGHGQNCVKKVFLKEACMLLQIEVSAEVDPYSISAPQQLVGLLFELKGAFHGVKDIEWMK